MLDVAPRDRVLAYKRPARNPGDAIIVLLNYGEQPVRVALPRSALPSGKRPPGLTDLLDGTVFAPQDRRGIPVPGHGVRILRVPDSG
jgi:hypothetical protein